MSELFPGANHPKIFTHTHMHLHMHMQTFTCIQRSLPPFSVRLLSLFFDHFPVKLPPPHGDLSRRFKRKLIDVIATSSSSSNLKVSSSRYLPARDDVSASGTVPVKTKSTTVKSNFSLLNVDIDRRHSSRSPTCHVTTTDMFAKNRPIGINSLPTDFAKQFWQLIYPLFF